MTMSCRGPQEFTGRPNTAAHALFELAVQQAMPDHGRMIIRHRLSQSREAGSDIEVLRSLMCAIRDIAGSSAQH